MKVSAGGCSKTISVCDGYERDGAGKNRHKCHDFRLDMKYVRVDRLFVGQVQ